MNNNHSATDAANALLQMATNNGQQNDPGVGPGQDRGPPQQPDGQNPQPNDVGQLITAMTALMQQNAQLMQMVNRNPQQETVLYNVLPDLSHNIQDFDGLAGSASAKVWLKQLESTANLHRWTEAVAFETARSHLSKAAKNWYIANIDTIVDWQTFRRAFSATFLVDKTLTEKWQEMQKRCQGATEDTREYFFDKVRLCKALNFGIDETKTQIATGLWSRNTSIAIMCQTHYDLDELLRGICEIEALDAARSQRIGKSVKQDTVKTPMDDRRKPTTEKSAGQQSTEKSAGQQSTQRPTQQPNTPQRSGGNVGYSGSGERVCYRCNDKGHIARDCPVKREVRCYNCNEIGHISRDCTKPRKPGNASINMIDPSTRNGGTKYRKSVTVGNVDGIDAVIDTGSSDCTIKASVMLLHNFAFLRAPNVLSGFGKSGNEVQSSCIIQEDLKVDDCFAENIVFRVVPDDVQPYDVIIGRNFTELPYVSYYKIDDRLEFRSRNDFIFATNPVVETRESGREIAKAAETIELPPASVNFVQVQLGGNEHLLPFENKSENQVGIKKGDNLDKLVMSIEGSVPVMKPRVEPITEDDVYVAPNVGAEEKAQLLALLNDYRVCSAMNDHELGHCRVIEMDIQEKPGSEPVFSKPYKASAEQREMMRKIVGDWKKAGIVTETDSPYASPVLLVMKADGTPRLVVDYRKLNRNTVRMNFPIPSTDDGFEELSGATIFAVLDLYQGYLQMALAEGAKHKTSFITPDETGQFERAMFGLMNAPFYFEKLLKKLFVNHGSKLALRFFDDILLHARSWTELMEKLEKVLLILKDAGLTLNLKKCKFGLEEVNYLGFTIGKNGVGPGERKVKAIVEFPTPKNVHEARRFHGMASYFRRFIQGFAGIAAPIIELWKKENSFIWGKRQDDAFREIKEKLASKPVLAHYNANAKRTELHTDASAEGLAAMLLQQNDLGEIHPVYAISRRTSDTERVYHSSKLELLAIVWAMERLRPLLIGIHFEVYTDCEALVYVNSLKTKVPQIVRWLGSIAEFDYEIHHRKGERMQHVDALSRAPVEPADGELGEATMFNVSVREDEILMYQRSDEELEAKIKILEKPIAERSRREKGNVEGYVLRKGMLYKRDSLNGEKELYVVPRAMRKALVIKNHDMSSHFGIDRTLARIREYYYFPRMRAYVRRHISSCVECIFSKNKVGKQAGELHPIPPGKRPFEVVNIDHLGPFVTTIQRNQYVLAAICNLTKFVQLYAVRDVKAATTVRKMRLFVERFGAPKRFITDRGTAFNAEKFDNFCNEHGIKHTLNSSRHAQANGQVERLNQTILPAMQANLNDYEGRNWDKDLSGLERDLNTSVCKTTGRTPFEMLYGYIPRFGEGLSRELTVEAESYTPPEEIRREVIEKIEVEQRVAKARYDKSRYKNVKYNVGDIVFVKCNPIATGTSTKLQARYRGPLVITHVLPSDTYRVQNLNSKDTQKIGTTAHVSQLKIWRGHDDENENEDDDLADDANSGDESSETENQPIMTNKEEIDSTDCVEAPSEVSQASPPVETERKSRRNRQRPTRFKDFEM